MKQKILSRSISYGTLIAADSREGRRLGLWDGKRINELQKSRMKKVKEMSDMKKSVFIIMVIAITFCSCKKTNGTNYPLNNELKAAFYFKTGTYWIYKDSVSGDIDSFFVRSSANGSSLSADKSASIEEIDIRISEYHILPAATDTQAWEFFYQVNTFDMFFPDKKIYTDKIEYIPLINYPFAYTTGRVAVGIYPAFGDTAVVDNIFETFPLNGQIFNNVAEVNHRASLNFNGYLPPFFYNDNFYLCPNIGFIKIKLNHPQDPLYRIWEMQRWKIVK
jgi:hypothetical protein